MKTKINWRSRENVATSKNSVYNSNTTNANSVMHCHRILFIQISIYCIITPTTYLRTPLTTLGPSCKFSSLTSNLLGTYHNYVAFWNKSLVTS